MDARLVVTVVLKVLLVGRGNSQPQNDQWRHPDEIALLSSVENNVIYLSKAFDTKMSIFERDFMEVTAKLNEVTRKFDELQGQIGGISKALEMCLARQQQAEEERNGYTTVRRQQDSQISEKIEGYGKKILRALQNVLDVLNNPQMKSDYQETVLRTELKKVVDKVDELAVSLHSNLAVRNLSASMQRLLLQSETQNGELVGLREEVGDVRNRLERSCAPLEGQLQAIWDSVSQLVRLGNLTSILVASRLEEAVRINQRGERRTAEFGDLEAQLLHAMRLGNDLANGISKEASVPPFLRNVAYNLSLLLNAIEQRSAPLLMSLTENHNALSIILGEMWQSVVDTKSYACFACRNGSVAAKLDLSEFQRTLFRKMDVLQCRAPNVPPEIPAVDRGVWIEVVGQLKMLNKELGDHKGDITSKMTVLHEGLVRIANTVDSLVSNLPEHEAPRKILGGLLGL